MTQPPSLHCRLRHEGLKPEHDSELHSCFGEPRWGGGQMEGCATGCQGAGPAHSEFCSPPPLRFLLANRTLPKWRGGEGCKPKLHLSAKLLYVLEKQGPFWVAGRSTSLLSTETGQGSICRCKEEWRCLQDQVFSSSGAPLNKCLRDITVGPGGTGGLRNLRPQGEKLPPVWATSVLSCPGSAVLVCHSLLPRGSGKELLASPLACLPAPLASHLTTAFLCQWDRQRGRLSLQKGQLHHWADVGMQLEGAGEKSPCGRCFLQVTETSLSSGSRLHSGCYGITPLTELNVLFPP